MRPPDMRDTRNLLKHLGGTQAVHLDKLLSDECPDFCWKVQSLLTTRVQHSTTPLVHAAYCKFYTVVHKTFDVVFFYGVAAERWTNGQLQMILNCLYSISHFLFAQCFYVSLLAIHLVTHCTVRLRTR